MHQRLILAAAAVVVIAALYFGQEVLVPVALSIFIAFVLSPLVARLEHWRMGRVPSVAIVTIASFALIVGIGWFIFHQTADLARRLPQYRENFQAKITVLRDKVQRPIEKASEAVEQLEDQLNGEAAEQEAGAPAAKPEEDAPEKPQLLAPLQAWLTAQIGSIFSVLGNAAIVGLLVFLMLLQRHDLRDRVIALCAGNGIVLPTRALDEGTRRISRYLLVLTILNCSHGAVVGLGLFLLGVPSALLFGLMSAVLRFIPYIGPWIAAAFPVVLSFAISDGLTTPLMVIGFFALIELISNNVVEPFAYQNNVGLSATAVVISAVFWTWLWGMVGLVLAIPLTVCLAIAGRYVPQLRFLHILLGDEPVLAPAPRLYHRVLAGDIEEAIDQVTKELDGGKPLATVYDEMVMPALAIAQQDHFHRAIDGETTADLLRGFREVVDAAAEAQDSASKKRSKDNGTVETAPEQRVRIVCHPAGGEADALACRMLAHALRLAKLEVHEQAPTALASETVEKLEQLGADALCVAQLPPLALHRIRYLLKRVSTRFADLPVLVGTWTVPLDPEPAQARLGTDAKLLLGSTVDAMVEHARRVASTPRESRPRLREGGPAQVGTVGTASTGGAT